MRFLDVSYIEKQYPTLYKFISEDTDLSPLLHELAKQYEVMLFLNDKEKLHTIPTLNIIAAIGTPKKFEAYETQLQQCTQPETNTVDALFNAFKAAVRSNNVPVVTYLLEKKTNLKTQKSLIDATKDTAKKYDFKEMWNILDSIDNPYYFEKKLQILKALMPHGLGFRANIIDINESEYSYFHAFLSGLKKVKPKSDDTTVAALREIQKDCGCSDDARIANWARLNQIDVRIIEMEPFSQKHYNEDPSYPIITLIRDKGKFYYLDTFSTVMEKKELRIEQYNSYHTYLSLLEKIARNYIEKHTNSLNTLQRLVPQQGVNEDTKAFMIYGLYGAITQTYELLHLLERTKQDLIRKIVIIQNTHNEDESDSCVFVSDETNARIAFLLQELSQLDNEIDTKIGEIFIEASPQLDFLNNFSLLASLINGSQSITEQNDVITLPDSASDIDNRPQKRSRSLSSPGIFFCSKKAHLLNLLRQQNLSLDGNIVDVNEDGNCFFHALLLGLKQCGLINDDTTHADLRLSGLQYIQENEDVFKDAFDDKDGDYISDPKTDKIDLSATIEKYIERMSHFGSASSTGGTWADGIIIMALAMKMQIHLRIIEVRPNDPNLLNPQEYNDKDESYPTITLILYNHHYLYLNTSATETETKELQSDTCNSDTSTLNKPDESDHYNVCLFDEDDSYLYAP